MSSDNVHTRAEALLAFVRKLREELLGVTPPTPHLHDETIHALEQYTSQIPLFNPSLPVPYRRQFDDEGVGLWNTCARLSLPPGDPTWLKQFSSVKILAFGMLEAARRTEVSETGNIIEVALSTAEDCIENGVLDTSHRIIEIVAMELDTLKSSACPDHDQTQSLEIQYYMIRIHLAWCQGRADIADHLYSQVPRVTQKGNQFTIMEMAYKIGGLALSSHQYDTAVKWSQRALNACEAWTEGGQKRGQPSDQRMLILHQNARAILSCDEASSGGSIQTALDNLKEYPTAFLVMVLRLEILCREKAPDWKEYIQVLYSAIGTMDLASSTVNVVLHYIQKLRYFSPRALLGGLKRLLTERLLLSCNRELTETAVVSFIWSLTVSVDCSAGVLDILNEGMKLLESAKLGTISETATEACLLAIWKHVDKEISRTNYLVAGNWCHFVLEQVIFLIASDNKEKLMRKLIVCALNSGETSRVYATFDSLPEGSKNNPPIVYLMYKLATQDNQSSKATVYLDLLFNQVEGGCSYLVACTFDALKHGDIWLAAKCLEMTMSTYYNSRSEGAEVAKLLRYVLCSLAERLNSLQGEELLLNQILKIIETVPGVCDEQMTLLSHLGPSFIVKKAHSIALKALKSSLLDFAVRCLDLSIRFTEMMQKAEGQEDRSNLYKKYLTYDALRTTAIIASARKERDQSKQQHLYTTMLQSTQRFRTNLQNLQNHCTTEIEEAWVDKYRIILSLDFEAAMFLDDWESALQIVQESAAVINEKLGAVFLDCVLRSGAPECRIAGIVKAILRTLHAHTNPSTTDPLLPRYLHVLFHLAITASDDVLAELVLDQVLSLARGGKDSLLIRYSPDDEIHWLASVAFNRAVDFYLVSADGDCHRWAQKAIELADCIGDEVSRGTLGRLLREKYTKLT